MRTNRLSKAGILRWAYSKPDGNPVGGISFIANVIDCHYSKSYELLKGLWRCAQEHEVRAGNTIDQVSIDGQIQPLVNLRNY